MEICKVIYLVVLFVSFSCNNNDSKREVILLKSAPIKLIEEDIQFAPNEECYINPKLAKNCFMKLIVYYDSTNCTPCVIDKMYIWDDLLNYSDGTNGKFKLYLIFRPSNSDSNKLKLSLRNHQIYYPILIDENGDFEKMNPHLPKNKAMHTFLLDENNKVILVGNPLHNKEIEKLFYNKTQELLAK